jgi:hypothetical protein
VERQRGTENKVQRRRSIEADRVALASQVIGPLGDLNVAATDSDVFHRPS